MKLEKILIEIIPHSEQRYETVGDYFLRSDGIFVIRVSEMKDWRYCAMVAIHELAEVYLTEHHEVSEETITQFDEAFEANRLKGNLDEPGDAVDCPYRDDHCFATSIERMMCAAFGLSWKEYEDHVNSLYQH